MKTITILCDGKGDFRCARVDNPEAYRRLAATETGFAQILFSVSPVLGAPIAPMLEQLPPVLVRFRAGPELSHCPHFLFAVASCLIFKPLLARYRRLAWSRLRMLLGVPQLKRSILSRSSRPLDGPQG